jgi:hypothetical protein
MPRAHTPPTTHAHTHTPPHTHTHTHTHATAPHRPTFKQLVERLESMLRQNRIAKKRAASSPAAPGAAYEDATNPASTGAAH